jgi:hypothetical protein
MPDLAPRAQGHPDLADCLSNLAILANARGDYAGAQPLYERALGIYEAAHGPDHPDVAHTLTDLAVLHLEQVRSTRIGQVYLILPKAQAGAAHNDRGRGVRRAVRAAPSSKPVHVGAAMLQALANRPLLESAAH